MGTTLPFRSTEPEDDYQGCSAPPTDENWVVFPLEFDPIAGTVVSSEPSVPSDPSLGSLCDVAAPVWNMTYLQGSTSHFEAQQTMPIRGHHGWASSMNAFEFQLDQEPVSNDLYYWDSEASNTSFSELQSLVNRDTSTSQMIYGDPTTPVDSFSSTFLGAELLSGYTQISASDALEDSSTGPVYYSDLPSDTVNIGESLGQLGPTARPFDSTNYIPDQSFGGASGEALVSSSQPFSYEDGGTCLDNAFPPGVKVMELLETPSQGIPSITPSSVKRKSRSSPSPEPDRAEPIPAKKSKSRRKKKDSRTDQSPCLHCKRRKVACTGSGHTCDNCLKFISKIKITARGDPWNSICIRKTLLRVWVGIEIGLRPYVPFSPESMQLRSIHERSEELPKFFAFTNNRFDALRALLEPPNEGSLATRGIRTLYDEEKDLLRKIIDVRMQLRRMEVATSTTPAGVDYALKCLLIKMDDLIEGKLPRRDGFMIYLLLLLFHDVFLITTFSKMVMQKLLEARTFDDAPDLRHSTASFAEGLEQLLNANEAVSIAFFGDKLSQTAMPYGIYCDGCERYVCVTSDGRCPDCRRALYDTPKRVPEFLRIWSDWENNYHKLVHGDTGFVEEEEEDEES